MNAEAAARGQWDPWAELADVMKLLGDRNRLVILALLQHGEMCVCELVDALQMSQPAVSQHLRKMKAYGLVRETRRKNWVFYSLDVDDKPYVKDVLRYAPSVEQQLADRKRQGTGQSCN